MTTAHKLTAALAGVLLVVLLWSGVSWLHEHDARLTLQTQQKADAENAAAIAAKEQENQQQLADQLKQLGQLKVTVQTPAQVVRALPQVVTLPQPVQQLTDAQTKALAALPDAPPAGSLVLSPTDAKAWYDQEVDCKVNATKVASCSDTVANLTALGKVKDTEIAQQQVALKGGTKWQRTLRALKWVGVGAGIGGGLALGLRH